LGDGFSPATEKIAARAAVIVPLISVVLILFMVFLPKAWIAVSTVSLASQKPWLISNTNQTTLSPPKIVRCRRKDTWMMSEVERSAFMFCLGLIPNIEILVALPD
jgi:biopolymer transport protein ExbD